MNTFYTKFVLRKVIANICQIKIPHWTNERTNGNTCKERKHLVEVICSVTIASNFKGGFYIGNLKNIIRKI